MFLIAFVSFSLHCLAPKSSVTRKHNCIKVYQILQLKQRQKYSTEFCHSNLQIQYLSFIVQNAEIQIENRSISFIVAHCCLGFREILRGAWILAASHFLLCGSIFYAGITVFHLNVDTATVYVTNISKYQQILLHTRIY